MVLQPQKLEKGTAATTDLARAMCKVYQGAHSAPNYSSMQLQQHACLTRHGLCTRHTWLWQLHPVSPASVGGQHAPVAFGTVDVRHTGLSIHRRGTEQAASSRAAPARQVVPLLPLLVAGPGGQQGRRGQCEGARQAVPAAGAAASGLRQPVAAASRVGQGQAVPRQQRSWLRGGRPGLRSPRPAGGAARWGRRLMTRMGALRLGLGRQLRGCGGSLVRQPPLPQPPHLRRVSNIQPSAAAVRPAAGQGVSWSGSLAGAG